MFASISTARRPQLKEINSNEINSNEINATCPIIQTGGFILPKILRCPLRSLSLSLSRSRVLAVARAGGVESRFEDIGSGRD